ncbi:MAG: endonuclease/exonuclease/phosphatase family protein [Anaerolineae bacterium]|nr:endonuclease/exonuclease/phosphatase family protein [Gloeobacterales cyanobacterium ES-bin-313]
MVEIEPSLLISSYNILATAYIRSEFYPHVNPEHLKWENRRAPLLHKIAALEADILCLQEVEKPFYGLLETHLGKQGYVGVYAQKHGKPDGCATLFKAEKLNLVDVKTLYYKDGQGERDSGHLALITTFETKTSSLHIINTHLKWDRTNNSKEAHWGWRQLQELLEKGITTDSAWILCGDFNVLPDSFMIQELFARGFKDAYCDQPQPTSNSNSQAKRIDYLFYTDHFTTIPQEIPEIYDVTPLPSEMEPSDHLAVLTIFQRNLF